jgi:hypothetical protein
MGFTELGARLDCFFVIMNGLFKLAASGMQNAKLQASFTELRIEGRCFFQQRFCLPQAGCPMLRCLKCGDFDFSL